ncbi:MAG: hypothetical protein LBQ62_01135, partial [Candidatus Accumulibacter sp.]|nr:hypothetical protein [Accumulibacter sp.]
MSRTLSLRGGGGGNSSLTLTAPEISLEGALSGGDAALILNPTNRLTLAADATLAGRSITLDGDANWSAGTLTLDADQEITINGVLNATGSAGFAANYAETDANHAGLIFQHASGAYRGGINIAADAVTLNGKTYSVLHTKGDLAALADDPAKNYVLGGDIAGLALSDLGSLGFVSGQEKYAGRFNGFGHTLSVSATSLENGVSPVALHGTRLLLSSPGDLDVNAPLTWQSGILALAAQGDININAPLTWLGTTYTAPHPLGDNAGLALNAQKNVRVNAAVTAGVLRPNYAYGYFTTRTWATLEINTGHAVNAATGAANLAASTAGQNADGTPWGLYMAYGVTGKVAASSNPGGFSGKINLYTTNSLRINGEDYTVINSQAEMEAIRENPGGNYALGVDPNSTGGNRQYTGYGTEAAPFTGHFNGLGHAMATGSGNSSGLFGVIGAGGAVSNLGVGGSVFYNNGADWAGTVAAKNYGSILQVFSTDQAGGVAGGAGGVPTGGMGVGGLVGYNNGLLANSFTYYQSGSGVVGIAGTQYAGGLVAYNDTEGRILNSYTTNKDSAAGTTFMGGAMNVANSILPDLAAGGLVGFNAGEIANSYALNGITLGVANTGGNIGGLVGVNADTGRIRNAYTAAHGITGDVANDIPLNIGSFAGENRGVIEASYAATPINARTFTVDTSDVLASAWSKSGSYNNLYLTPEIFGDTSSVVVTNEDGSITYEAGAGKDYTVSGVSYLRTTVSSKITYGQTLKVTYPHKNFEHGEMGATKLAGFVGNNTGSVTNGYFDTALTKMAQGGDSGVTALEAAAAQSLASYAGFDSG